MRFSIISTIFLTTLIVTVNDALFSSYIQLGHLSYFLVRLYKEKGLKGISPIHIFLAVNIISTISNLVGLHSDDTSFFFHSYFLMEYSDEAAIINFIGVSFTFHGFMLGGKSGKTPFPKLKSNSSSAINNTIIVLGFLTLALNYFNFFNLYNFGTFHNLFLTFPIIVIFYTSFYGKRTDNSFLLYAAYILMGLETVRAVLFDYLRYNIVIPALAFFLGNIIGSYSLRPLKSFFMVPVYVGLTFFVIYFSYLGSLRQHVTTGYSRISQFTSLQEDIEDKGSTSSFVARFSTLSQISQIAKLTHENGLYLGETVSYFIYAFIPRILWPEKPIIAKGAWFANEIGAAFIRENKINNSVNMTISGELFLNFGYLGLIFGSLLVGVLFSKLWLTTDFINAPNNYLGAFFGFYLMNIARAQFGADLQIIVTVIAVYLIFLFFSKLPSRSK